MPIPSNPRSIPAKLRDALVCAVGADAVLTDDAALRAYDSDAYPLHHASPHAVVLPTTTEQSRRRRVHAAGWASRMCRGVRGTGLSGAQRRCTAAW